MLTHIGTVTLTTPRLKLRRLEVSDAQAMYDNWTSKEEVAKYLSWNIHGSPEETKEILTKWVADYENPEYYHWAIEFDDTMIPPTIQPKDCRHECR